MNDLISRDKYEIDEASEKREMEKQINISFILDRWMHNIENDKNIKIYFDICDYKSVAIYGMGVIGKHLMCQLEQADVRITYYIEKNIVYYNERRIPLDELKSITPLPDVIVITPIMDYKQIKRNLEKIVDIPIVSIEEVVLSV